MQYGGKTFITGQGNNAYIFPGVALGVIVTGTHHIPEDMFLIAAQVVADHVSEADLEKGSLYPPLSAIKECSMDIAVGVTNYAYQKGKQMGGLVVEDLPGRFGRNSNLPRLFI